MAPEQPLLVVRGMPAHAVHSARLKGLLAGGALVVGTFVAGTLLLPGQKQERVPMPLVLVVCFFGGYVVERFLRGAQGSVAFYEARIVISKQATKGLSGNLVEHTEQLLWSEVKGFRDDSADYVTLVATAGEASFLKVPTLTEEDRVAVLQLLDSRGIPRVD